MTFLVPILIRKSLSIRWIGGAVKVTDDSNKKFGYEVFIDQHCNTSYHSGELYGDWSESYSNYFRSVNLKSTNHPDVISDTEFKAGDKIWLVWVEYSTGDSFGHGYRSRVDSVAVFDNPYDAVELKNWIEDTKHENWEYTTEFKTR